MRAGPENLPSPFSRGSRRTRRGLESRAERRPSPFSRGSRRGPEGREHRAAQAACAEQPTWWQGAEKHSS